MARGNATPPSPQHDQSHPKPKPKHWLEYAIFLFVVATAVATGFAAWYTRQQWQTAHETMVYSERAFVHVDGPSIFVGRDVETGSPLLGITAGLANSGNTPTKTLEFLLKCVKSETKLIEPWGLLHQGDVTHLPQLIAPKTTAPISCSFDAQDVIRINKKQTFGYILIDVSYYDVFNQQYNHVTQLSQSVSIIHVDDPQAYAASYTLDSPFPTHGEAGLTTSTAGSESAPKLGLTVQFTPIGKHNCADEDCPKN